MNQRRTALPPGSLIYVGNERKHKIRLFGVLYSKSSHQTFDVSKTEEIPEPADGERLWLNVSGIHKVSTISALGKRFSIPDLALEDIMNSHHRVKCEELPHHLLLVFKMLYLKQERIAYEHLSLILGQNMVLTFQEQPGDVFDPVRKRLEEKGRRIRNNGCDYLLYALVDALVDNYLLAADSIEEKIQNLETRILEQESDNIVQELQALQRECIFLGKSFRAGREAVNQLQRKDITLIQKETNRYLLDVYDHSLQAVESIDLQSELLTSLDTLYFNLLNQRTNETMKVLTLYASIFLPLTFLAGNRLIQLSLE